MRPNNGLYCAFAVVLAGWCLVDSSRACSCTRPDPVRMWELSESVFVGEICTETLVHTGRYHDRLGRMVMFQVLQSWKEDDQAEQRIVIIPRDSGLCGPNQVELGDRSLVYASPDSDWDGMLYTDICWRTNLLCGGVVGDESIRFDDLHELEAAGIEALRSDGPSVEELASLCVEEPVGQSEPCAFPADPGPLDFLTNLSLCGMGTLSACLGLAIAACACRFVGVRGRGKRFGLTVLAVTVAIVLAGCEATSVNRPEGGEIEVVFDETLVVAVTDVNGMLEDPALTNGLSDLSRWEYSATAWCRTFDCTEIELRIESPRIPTSDPKNIIIDLHDADSVTMSADAILIQATDSMVYDPCERTPYEYDFCERTLAATGGEIRFAEFMPPIGEASDLSGTFEFETAAGTVEGSFGIIGVVAEADYTVYTPQGE